MTKLEKRYKLAYKVQYLLENSNLPGPRANLELLYTFTKEATEKEICDCLNIQYYNENSPEEFVLTCGVSGSIYHAAKNDNKVGPQYQKYANHKSWRVREGICIGFQKSYVFLSPEQMIADLQILSRGTPLEMRTYVATLSEPCLLRSYINPNWLLEELFRITTENLNHSEKISDDLKILRKALGYCWSVALCGEGADKTSFEKLLPLCSSKHIEWIVKENLKKNRLLKLDKDWVNQLFQSL